MTAEPVVGDATDAGKLGWLKFADEELMVGHILTSVAAWGPELEVNLVLSSMGQEELGHARLFYGRVFGETDAAVNAAIYDRPESDFRSSRFAELYSADWADLVVKHYLYDSAEDYRLPILAGPQFDAAVLERVRAEEQFQREFWSYWFDRVASASPATRARIQRALTLLWPLAGTLFELPRGPADSSAELWEAHERWHDSVRTECDRLGLELPSGGASSALGGDRARIIDEMRSVYSAAPGRW